MTMIQIGLNSCQCNFGAYSHQEKAESKGQKYDIKV